MDELEFELTKREWGECILFGLGISVICGYLFYKSVAGILFLIPCGIGFIRKRKESVIKKKRMQFNIQFKDAIHCIAASLEAGYSIENAIRYAISDLKLMYEEDSYIIAELNRICMQLRDHVTIEEGFMQMAKRTKDEDVLNFAEIFVTAKRTGGDLIKIIKETSNTIEDKIQMKREIETMITEKQLEANIMKIVPLGILIYMNLTSHDMMSVLYEGVFGSVFMTAILLCYLAFGTWMNHITAIAG